MIRLVSSSFLFLVSLLSVLPAPTYHLWLLEIAVTEYPWIFIILAIILVLTGYWFHDHTLWVNIISIAAIVLFISPVVRANAISSTLRSELENAFGKYDPISGDAFSVMALFKSSKTVSYRSLPYKNIPGKTLGMDFYPSQISGNRPCVIVIHGGSWSTGDSRQLPELNSYLASIGYHVAALNYRLVPKYQNPAPVEDVKDAIAFLKSKAAELNIDSTAFVLLGRSAGAQIALLSAYTLHEPAVKGVIDFYGPADMVWGYSIPSNPWVMNSREVMEHYLGGTYDQYPANYRASSPILYTDRQTVPTLLIHGKNDVLVSYQHSIKLSKKLHANGVKHYLLTLPWGAHGFDFNLNGPGGQLSTYAVTYFLRSVTE